MAKKKEETITLDGISIFEKQMEEFNSMVNKKFTNCSFFPGANLKNNTSSLSTGSPAVDVILRRPIPVGIHELAGPYQSGKSTMGLHICASAQKKGWPTFYVNMERALNPESLARIEGLDPDKLFIFNPYTGEAATELILDIFRKFTNAVVILDSVTGCMATEAVIEKNMNEKTMGALGNLMSTFLAKAVPIVDDSSGRLILINQIRGRLNPYESRGLGNVSTTGGFGIEHWTTQRLLFKGGNAKGDRIENKETKSIVGKKVTVEVIKNRVGFPAVECEMYISAKTGIWKERELLQLAVDFGVIQKGGAWYDYKDQHVGQGEDAAFVKLSEDKPLFEEIKTKVYELTGLNEV